MTLLELLIALGLGLMISAAVAAIFVSSRNAYALLDDSARLDDNGRFAIEVLTRAVRQSDYRALDALSESADTGPAINGWDAHSLKGKAAGIAQSLTAAVNGSDVLAVRFSGAGAGAGGDGSIVNCAGFGVAERVDKSDADAHGWSIFYVAKGRTGEPELYCRYRGKSAWASAAIARGVESFQVLYGVGESAASLPRRFLSASQIDALDDELPLRGTNAVERALDKSMQSHWRKISEVRVALLVRGTQAVRGDKPTLTHDLFGADYAARQGAVDPGSSIREAALPASQRARLRRIFGATIRVRNANSVGSP